MKNMVSFKLMRLVGSLALLSAVLLANTICPLFGYQDEEPESVRKLRRF